jgi:hypothetical protein
MKYLNLVTNVFFLSTIVVGVSAVRTERLFGEAENANERELKSSCPYKGQYKLEEYYNAAFFLNDKENKALCDCSDSDMIVIGEILRNTTAQVDEKFPDYVPEVLKVNTEVCILPCRWEDNSTGTQQSVHRKLGTRTYTYKSGGTCHRCATASRLAVDTFKQLRGRRHSLADSTPAQMAKEACDFAEVSQFAYDKSKAAVKQIGDSLDNMEESTDEDYLKKRREIEKIAAEMTEELEDSVQYTLDAENACIKAKDLAEKGDEKKTEECLKYAKDAAEKAMKGLESVQKGHQDAKKKHMESKKSLLKAEKEEAKERTSRAVENMENELKILLEDLDRQIKEAKDLGDKEHMESLKQEAQTQKNELESEKKSLEEELKEADKYEGTLASLLLSAEFAKDYEEWMKIYKKCLEVVTLWELMENFNKEKGGCINKESNLKVEVTFDVKDDDVDTLEKICSKENLVQGDVPCDNCDGVP